MSDPNLFDPVSLSLAENQFLLEHLGEAPIVAFNAGLPPRVNQKAVTPVLQRVYDLEELKAHKGEEWLGIDAMKDAISTYMKFAEQWAVDAARFKRAPRFPSLYSYDARRRPHWAATGSDAHQVRTYFNANGERVPFAVEYIPTGQQEWNPAWALADEPVSGLVNNEEQSRLECSVCGFTASYKQESRASFNAARGRMSKHLRQATDKVEEHREIHTLEFGA